jgi:hypothetical protein
MLYSKQELIDIIDQEISDREDTFNGSSPQQEFDLKVEIAGLYSMKLGIEREEALEHSDYMWLCDLVRAYIETINN